MRYTNLVAVGFTMVACACGCGSNGNNNSRAANALGQDAPPVPLATPDKISADTRFAAGQLAESRGDYGAAIQQYSEALKIDSQHQLSIYRLGVLFTESKQYARAIDAWRQFIRVTNGSAVAYSNAAFCFELAGKTAEAEDCYKLGIKKDPSNQPCRVNYGLMLARTGRVKEATDQLSAVLRPAEVHYNLGSVYEQLGRKDEAKAEYDRALELNPEFWEAKTRLSKLE